MQSLLSPLDTVTFISSYFHLYERMKYIRTKFKTKINFLFYTEHSDFVEEADVLKTEREGGMG